MSSLGTRKAHLLGTLATVGAICIWSTASMCVRYLAGYVDLWTQNFYRYLAACLVLFPSLVVAVRRKQVGPTLWLRAAPVAAFNIVWQSAWAASLYYIHPAFMSLLATSSVLWTALLSFGLFADERPLFRDMRFWAGMLLSVVGLFGVMLSGKDFRVEGTATGIALTLISALLWALYTVSARIAFKHVSSRTGFGIVSVYTVVGLGIAAAIFSDPLAGRPSGAGPWAAIIISGVLCLGVAHSLYYTAMKRIGATVPSLMMLSLPFLILPQSWLIFGEHIIPVQWVWGSVLICGSVLCIVSRSSVATPPS